MHEQPPPRVLLDVDGVIADFVGTALRVVNDLFGTSHTSADVTRFDIAGSLGLSDDQRAIMQTALSGTPRLAAGLAVLPGAADGVRRLREIAEVYIVTSSWDSNETWEFDRKAWLFEHFGISRSHVIFAHAKHVCSGDFLIDDKTSTLVAWRDENPVGVAVQWVTQHNLLDAWSGVSASSWDDLIKIVGYSL